MQLITIQLITILYIYMQLSSYCRVYAYLQLYNYIIYVPTDTYLLHAYIKPGFGT